MIKVLKKDIDLKSTLLSGQCFRVSKYKDGYITILKDRVIFIKEKKKYLIIESSNKENLKEIIIEYLDLNRDYTSINNFLSSQDSYMNKIIKECNGLKILNQDSFEMYISYIISQNNNVKRISKIIESISKKYGKKVFFENKEYYLFPEKEAFINISIEDLKRFGLGYRTQYIKNALKKLKEDNNFVNKINTLDTENALTELMTVKGIGLKVASCILLFGFSRLDVFPIDTWVKQNIAKNYKELKINYKSIKAFTEQKYKNFSGMAIQYMFHSERNKKKSS